MKIEKDLFWDLLENSEYGDWKFENLYLELIAERLKKETGVYFSANGSQIKSNALDFVINAKDFSTYSDLVKKIEAFLGTGDEKFDKELKNHFNWLKDYFWFYADKRVIYGSRWATDSNGSKSDIFEIIYYAITGKFHEDRSFSLDLMQKYLQNESRDAFFGKVVIPELDSVEINFQKNQYIKIKGLSDTEWDRIDHLFSLIGNRLNR